MITWEKLEYCSNITKIFPRFSMKSQNDLQFNRMSNLKKKNCKNIENRLRDRIFRVRNIYSHRNIYSVRKMTPKVIIKVIISML